MLWVYFVSGQSILITEIMYDPPASCPEYAEISNITIRDLTEQHVVLENSAGRKVELMFEEKWPAGESRIITPDREQFIKCYPEADTGVVYKGTLFALSNSGTGLILTSTGNLDMVIDHVFYSPENHNETLSKTKGVALERNIEVPADNKWRSGFVQFGYRSPGYLPLWMETARFNIKFSTTIIYPRASQRISKLEILLESNEVDGKITIDVYNVNGEKVQTIANGVPVQGGEIFIWNGQSASGQVLSEGLYLFWIYYFDTTGHKRVIKKTCVLSNS